jgi:type III pantothenate kinase
MLLAIDVGNTNTKFAIHDGQRMIGAWRLATHRERTADEYAVWFTQLMEINGVDRHAVRDAIIATVVPPTLFNLRRLCEKYFDLEPLIVGDPGCKLGIAVKYNPPGGVGADRLVDAIGAHVQWPGAKIVIDFGTATTFNIVDANGDYLGGAICPGVNTNIEALHMVAARLPRIEFDRPETVIGRDTVTAMKSGTYWGYIAMVEGMCARIRAEFGAELTVVATGGHAERFAGGTDVIQHVAPDLTMRGFVEIWRRNRTPPGG